VHCCAPSRRAGLHFRAPARAARAANAAGAADGEFKLPGLTAAAKVNAFALPWRREADAACDAVARAARVRRLPRNRPETLRPVRRRWHQPGGPVWRAVPRWRTVLVVRGAFHPCAFASRLC
jgi:hypothetical protein